MRNQKKDKYHFLENKNNINLVASNPGNGKLDIILEILNEFGLKQKKKILFFNFDGPNQFYITSLLAVTTKKDKRALDGYFNPCRISSKTSPKIEEHIFFENLEKLKESKIYMCEFQNQKISVDLLDYILDYDEERNAELLIINYFDILLKKSQNSLEKILEKLREYAKKNSTHMVLIYNQENKLTKLEELENKKIFQKWIPNIIIKTKK